MQRSAFVVNIYDPLNFDMAFPESLPVKYESGINQAFTFYETTDILDPFLFTERQVAHEYEEYIPDDQEPTPIRTGRSYRCHMKDLKFRLNAKYHTDYYNVKRLLIQWTNLHNGWVKYRLFNVDIYKRLIVEILDPETGESFKDYLLTNYGNIFCHCREQPTTIHMSDIATRHDGYQWPKVFGPYPTYNFTDTPKEAWS